jgi:predicted Zn-dependent protease
VDVLFALGGVNTQGAFMRAGQAAGAGFHSVEFEAEADYVGVYYMARAGYQVDGVEDFWRRFGAEHANAIFVKSDHPAAPARYLAIARARDEVVAKRKPLRRPLRNRPARPTRPRARRALPPLRNQRPRRRR